MDYLKDLQNSPEMKDINLVKKLWERELAEEEDSDSDYYSSDGDVAQEHDQLSDTVVE